MNRPNAHELLSVARDVLLKQLMPALPEELHYECRMVASAMAIAGREVELAATVEQVEEQSLLHALGQQGAAGGALEEVRALLCQLIRRGVYDQAGLSQDALLLALAEITRARLRISNPKVVSDDC